MKQIDYNSPDKILMNKELELEMHQLVEKYSDQVTAPFSDDTLQSKADKLGITRQGVSARLANFSTQVKRATYASNSEYESVKAMLENNTEYLDEKNKYTKLLPKPSVSHVEKVIEKTGLNSGMELLDKILKSSEIANIRKPMRDSILKLKQECLDGRYPATGKSLYRKITKLFSEISGHSISYYCNKCWSYEMKLDCINEVHNIKNFANTKQTGLSWAILAVNINPDRLEKVIEHNQYDIKQGELDLDKKPSYDQLINCINLVKIVAADIKAQQLQGLAK